MTPQQEYQKIYCQTHKKQRREYMRGWEARNRDKCKIYNRRRYIKERLKMGKPVKYKEGDEKILPGIEVSKPVHSIAELGIKKFMAQKAN